MTEQQTIAATVFGRVLGEFMEARGFEPTPAQIIALGERSGLDGRELLRGAQRPIGTSPRPRRRQNLGPLASHLGLSEEEMMRIAMAYTFEQRS